MEEGLCLCCFAELYDDESELCSECVICGCTADEIRC